MTSAAAPTPEQIDAILDTLFKQILDEGDRKRRERPPGPPEWVPEGPDDPDDEEALERAWNESPLFRELEHWKGDLQTKDFRAVARALEPILAAGDLQIDPQSPQAYELYTRALRVGIRAHKINIERELGEFSEDNQIGAGIGKPAIHSAAGSIATSEEALGALLRRAAEAAEKDAPLLSELFNEYMRSRTGKLTPEERREFNIADDEDVGDGEEDFWGESHRQDAQIAWKLWEELVGDCRVDPSLATKAWEFRRKLAWVPALHGRSVFTTKDGKPMHARDAIKLANAIEKSDFIPNGSKALKAGLPVPRLSVKTRQKHLAFFHAMFRSPYIRRRGFGNPFEGILYSKKFIRKKSRPTRTNLSPDEQIALFETPIWRGCRSPLVRTQPGEHIIRDAMFWMPLLAAFQGLRQTEGLQLWLDDIIEAHGTHWICMRNGPGRRLKTEASERSVPVHPILARIGFVEYCAELRKRGELRVFPDFFKKDDRTGHPRSGAFSKAFSYYRNAVGFTGRWKDFHAERHTVNTVLLNNGVPPNVVACLLGHEGGYLLPRPYHMTNDVYFGGYEPRVLIDAINKLDYPGLDLSHLYTR